MTKSQVNPFLPTRYERHDRALIWVSERVRVLEAKECVYVCGTRGSGKTSLLRAIHWLERIENESLIEQVGSEFPGYVGIYFRIADYVTESLSSINWANIYPETNAHDRVDCDYFTNFIELIAMEQICDSIISLRQRSVFSFTPDEERQFISNFIPESILLKRALANNIIESVPLSFHEMKYFCRAIHTEMYLASTRGTVSQLLDKLPLDKGGKLLQAFCEAYKNFHMEFNKTNHRNGLYFKICIDDCEATNNKQQVYLNTLVRQHKHPVFWILSFVDRQYEATATLIQNQDLTDADRKIVFLDSMPIYEFRTFCEKVSELRFRYLEKDLELPTRKNEFSLQRILGKTQVNSLIMSDSESKLHKGFRALLDRAKNSGIQKHLSARGTLGIDGDIQIPVYQQYILEKLFPGRELTNVVKEQGDALGPFLRRKEVAAFLSIKSEFKLQNAGFSGAEAVVGMADGCIRDYLEMMAEVFEVAINDYGQNAQSFRLRPMPISVEKQRSALFAASQKKAAGYNSKVDRGAMRSAKMIEALGRLTHLLQADHNDIRCLRTPERGVFVFHLNEVSARNHQSVDEARRLIFSTLQKCELDGLLLRPSRDADVSNFLETDTSILRYRLHARFAAAYGFSYRGAYAEVKVPIQSVLDLCENPNSVVADRWAADMAKVLSNRVEGQWELEL